MFPLRRTLLAATALIACLGLAAELVLARTPDARWAGYFSLSYEGNLPTWYASSLLLGIALLCAERAHRGPERRHWLGLALALAYVSLDEATELHENLGGIVGTTGLLSYDWVIPAAVVLLVGAAIYLPFLRRLPAPLRGRLVIAGAIYVTGALLVELPLGWWAERSGDDNLIYGLIDCVEETLELVGASLAAAALWEAR